MNCSCAASSKPVTLAESCRGSQTVLLENCGASQTALPESCGAGPAVLSESCGAILAALAKLGRESRQHSPGTARRAFRGSLPIQLSSWRRILDRHHVGMLNIGRKSAAVGDGPPAVKQGTCRS